MVAGRYRIHDLIDEDDSGVLFRADDLQSRSPVELRLLAATETADPAGRERLLAAARLSRRLRGPHVQRTLDVVVKDKERLFLVREPIQGRSLRSILSEHGSLPQGNALRIISEVGRALEEAHGLGLVHGDLSPTRVTLVSLRRGDGTRTLTKVSDFGIAARTRLPAEGVLPEGLGPRGTPGYISPEAIRGEAAGERSDVYALGAVLYEMLTGRAPFARPSARETLRAQLAEDPPPMTDGLPNLAVDPAIEALAIQSLSSSPDARPVNARAFVDALAAALGRSTPSPSSAQPSPPNGDRRDMATRPMVKAARGIKPPLPGAPRAATPAPGAPRAATPPPGGPRANGPAPGAPGIATPSPGTSSAPGAFSGAGRRATPAPPSPNPDSPVMPAEAVPVSQDSGGVLEEPAWVTPKPTPGPGAPEPSPFDDDDYFLPHDAPAAGAASPAQSSAFDDDGGPKSGAATGTPWIDSGAPEISEHATKAEEGGPAHAPEYLELAKDAPSDRQSNEASAEPTQQTSHDANHDPESTSRPEHGATQSPAQGDAPASASTPSSARSSRASTAGGDNKGFSLEQPKSIAGIPVHHLPWFAMALLIVAVFGFLASNYADDRSGDTRGAIVRIPEKSDAPEEKRDDVAALISVGEQMDLDRISPRIHIDSRPTGAAVTRDGVGVGRTPMWLRIPAGREELELRLERAGYTEQLLILERGGPDKYLVGLDPLPVE